MSSIDKGVEQVVNRLGRNVRVIKRGNTIYGYMGGEVVFTLADRYGYVNTAEEQIIRDGIRRYDEEQARREAEKEAARRAREEAIRRAKEEAERLRREQLEAQRQRAYSDLSLAVRQKREELTRAVKATTESEKTLLKEMNERKNAVASLKQVSARFNFSEFEKRNASDEIAQRASVSADTDVCKTVLADFERFAAGITPNMTTNDYKSLAKDVCEFRSSIGKKSNFAYENGKFMEELNAISGHLRAIMPAITELERLAKEKGEIGIVAKEALDSISSRKVTSTEDFADFSRIAADRLTKVTELAEDAEVSSALYEISVLEGAISACKETYEIVSTSTYRAADHRVEIENNAIRVAEGFRALLTKEYTTCDKARINEVVERLEAVISGGEKSEDVLRETELLSDELDGYVQSDETHRTEYEEYLEIVKALSEYGVDSAEIEAFSPNAYSQQKQTLTGKLILAEREFERSQLIITDMHVKNIMDEMGFDLFATVGDAEGYVRESLYTKRGYDGVLWQTITYANGSVYRRIIGVNKGETETDVEYVKEVAAEMEQRGDPEEFIVRFRDATDSDVEVNTAVEHDSEDADEAIRRNGYHYLSDKALENYQRLVEIPREQTGATTVKSKVSKPSQKRIVSGKAIKNSADSLKRAVSESRALSYAKSRAH
jgi:hypothetical protein